MNHLLNINTNQLFAINFGDIQSTGVLKAAIGTGQLVFEGFKGVWNDVIFDTSSPLWTAIIRFSFDIALIVLIWVAINKAQEIVEKQDYRTIIKLFIFPLIFVVFLGNNGFLLSQALGSLRGITNDFQISISQTQIAAASIRDDLKNIQLSNAGRERIDAIINECNSLTGTDYSDCLNAAIPKIDQIVAEAESLNNGNVLTTLAKYKDDIKDTILNVVSVGTAILAPQKLAGTVLIHAILIAIQVAFNMIIEVSLLLHSLLAPIALAFTLIPAGKKFFIGWITAYIAIAGVQICYTIIIGLTASAIVLSGAQLFSDITFLVLTAFFAPGLAYSLSKGGGVAIYQGINRSINTSVSVVTTAATKAATAGAL